MESEELSAEKNKSKQAEIVPKKSSTVGSSVKSEHPGNLSATTAKTGYISFRMFIIAHTNLVEWDISRQNIYKPFSIISC